MKSLHNFIPACLLIFIFTGCNQQVDPGDNRTTTTSTVGPLETGLVQPEDLIYQGAFRLPDTSSGSDWTYSGYAMTYYPFGDPGGDDDGYPGSLFAVGSDLDQCVSEISIPAPVISAEQNPEELNTAETLQPFNKITGLLFGYLEIPRAGIEYLPAQTVQTSGKLHFCWGQHFQDFESSHGWCELDLSRPKPQGPWHFGIYTNYVSNDYLFEIPASWAERYTPGQRLASGRFRDGHWGGLGPALFACGPWNDGTPPDRNATLESITPLLLYGEQTPGGTEITISEDRRMDGFKEPDEWSGGAWLTAGDTSAVVLAGTKALGNCWYGFSNGVEYPISGDPDEEYPEVPDWPHDDRGWWSEDIAAQMIFFDPADLSAVAQGTMQPWEPQPYATLDLDQYLYDPGYAFQRKKRYLVGAAAFDREHSLLYVVERRADVEDKSLVHVWKVQE